MTHEVSVRDAEEISAEGRRRVAEVLAALGITRVISVDDSWAQTGVGADTVAEALVGGGAVVTEAVKALAEVFPEERGLDQADPDRVAAFVRREWDSFHEDLRQTLTALASEVDLMADTDDASALGELKSQMPEHTPLERMGLAQWREAESDIAKLDEGVLVLFDQDLSKDGGTSDTGLTLLSDLIDRKKPNLRAALLTLTLKNEQEEASETARLEGQFDAPPGTVLAIGKYRLNRDRAGSFPTVLRVLLAAKEIEAFRDFALRALKDASSEAHRTLSTLQRYSVAGALASAAAEGSYELDGPMRVALRAFERSIRSRTRHPDWSTVLASVRSIDLGSYLSLADHGEQFAHLLSEDAFEHGPHLNVNHSLLEVGDIFELKSLYPPARDQPAARTYILLAQACDLSVRLSGRREPNISTVVLHELVPKEDVAPNHSRFKAVGRFNPGDTRDWFIDLSKRLFVPVSALDAVVFNSDGTSTIDPRQDVANLPLPLSWHRRGEKIRQEADGWLRSFAEHRTRLRGANASVEADRLIGAAIVGAAAKARNGLTYSIDEDLTRILFGIRRVSRLHGSRAAGLVSLASAYDARPAFEAPLII